MQYENERVEFKSQLTEQIYKEVVAFANTEGGTILLGVNDRGEPAGLSGVDDTYTRLTNGIRDAIAPDVTMSIRYTLQENQVIRIDVGEGSHKPYYLKAKGMKSNGVYIRQGASSVQASESKIREMIKCADGDVFESMRSMEQDLTFVEAAAFFARYHVAFSEDKFIALGMRKPGDDQYTNLAWLLSDQCRHTVKVAVFADDANTIFQDAREFSGSVFRQLDESYAYLSLCNRKAATFRGLERVERQDYPEEALREGLLNALVHRDYSYSGSIIINVNRSGMEFVSLGGLVSGLTTEDILRNSISQPRNQALAAVFYRLRLIESYGTGIRRILNLYQGEAIQPQILDTPHSFKLTLPNRNANPAQKMPEQPSVDSAKQPTAQMQVILDFLNEYGEMSMEEFQELLNVKKTRAYLLARQMVEANLLTVIGRGSGKRYRRSSE